MSNDLDKLKTLLTNETNILLSNIGSQIGGGMLDSSAETICKYASLSEHAAFNALLVATYATAICTSLLNGTINWSTTPTAFNVHST